MSLSKRVLMAASAAALALSCVAGISVRSTMAAPEPAVIPPQGVWELTFKQYAPERIEIADASGKKTTYYYMRYTVTNNTGKDVLYTPDFELVTDTGQAIPAFKGVDRDVYLRIKKLYNSKLMESRFEILGKLLQGEDNSRDGIAIWTGVEPDARYFTIFVTGLSNETATTKNPITNAEVVLQKSLQIEYKMPGQQIGIDPKPEFKGRKWVMK